MADERGSKWRAAEWQHRFADANITPREAHRQHDSHVTLPGTAARLRSTNVSRRLLERTSTGWAVGKTLPEDLLMPAWPQKYSTVNASSSGRLISTPGPWCRHQTNRRAALAVESCRCDPVAGYSSHARAVAVAPVVVFCLSRPTEVDLSVTARTPTPGSEGGVAVRGLGCVDPGAIGRIRHKGRRPPQPRRSPRKVHRRVEHRPSATRPRLRRPHARNADEGRSAFSKTGGHAERRRLPTARELYYDRQIRQC